MGCFETHASNNRAVPFEPQMSGVGRAPMPRRRGRGPDADQASEVTRWAARCARPPDVPPAAALQPPSDRCLKRTRGPGPPESQLPADEHGVQRPASSGYRGSQAAEWRDVVGSRCVQLWEISPGAVHDTGSHDGGNMGR